MSVGVSRHISRNVIREQIIEVHLSGATTNPTLKLVEAFTSATCSHVCAECILIISLN